MRAQRRLIESAEAASTSQPSFSASAPLPTQAGVDVNGPRESANPLGGPLIGVAPEMAAVPPPTYRAAADLPASSTSIDRSVSFKAATPPAGKSRSRPTVACCCPGLVWGCGAVWSGGGRRSLERPAKLCAGR